MGKRGPPKKPAELKVALGTIRSNGIRPEDLAKSAERLYLPAWLRDDPEACEIFDAHRRILEPLGLLTAADSETFAQLCSLQAHYRRANREWIAGGVLTENAHGETKQNPAAAQAIAICGRLRPLQMAFGLSPADRLHKSAGDGDDLDRLIKAEVG